MAAYAGAWIRGEIERVFNQSMEAPDRWADLGFANLLGRYEEAKAHNAPIAAERQRQADERRAQQDAREQQLAQERQARYVPPSVRPKEILWRGRR